jgi:hypothetical protein
MTAIHVLDKHILFDVPGLLQVDPALTEAGGEIGWLVGEGVNNCIAAMGHTVS